MSTEVQITPTTTVTVKEDPKVGVGIQTILGLVMTAIPTIIAILSAIDGSDTKTVAGLASAILVAIVTQKNRTDQAVAKINAAAIQGPGAIVQAAAVLSDEDVVSDEEKLADTGVPVDHAADDLSDEIELTDEEKFKAQLPTPIEARATGSLPRVISEQELESFEPDETVGTVDNPDTGETVDTTPHPES